MKYQEFIGVKNLPITYWSNLENVKNFIKYVFNYKKYETIEDWYKIQRRELFALSSSNLLKDYKTICNLLNIVYKGWYVFYPWKFESGVPPGYWDDIENIRYYINYIFKKLNYSSLEDWYNVKREDISKNGSGLISKYSSVINILKRVYPQKDWYIWKFKNIGICNFWDNFENHKIYMEWLSKELNYSSMEDWYGISSNIIIDNYGVTLLSYYKNSYVLLLKNIYKDYEWDDEKFNIRPKGFWDNIENCKKFMDNLYIKLNYSSMEDWYNVIEKDISDNRGINILNKYKNTINLLQNIYPDYDWIIWKFKRPVPEGYWSVKENRLKCMEWLFKELKYKTMEDWYRVTVKDFKDNDCFGLIWNYRASYQALLSDVYPDYNWIPWKFNVVPHKFWDNKDNQRKYFDWAFKELGYTNSDDWYSLTSYTIESENERLCRGIYSITVKYNDTLYETLRNIYPEKEWYAWKFSSVPNRYWDEIENRRKYMDWLFKELNYSNMEDWYKTNRDIISKNHGASLVRKYSTIYEFFKEIYPEYNWDIKKFKCLKGESYCYDFLTTIDKDIIWQHFAKWCRNPKLKSKKILPFDFVSEKYKTIIELDGGGHFEKVSNWEHPEEIRERDVYKMRCALENGYSVIRILWEDVYENKNSWKERLTEVIKTYDNPKIIYLSDKYNDYQEYKDFYNQLCESCQ